MRRFFRTTPVLLAAALVTGCASFKLKDPPPGFAEVSAWGDNARYKAGDDVGINITAFRNVKGGTLAFWSEDMIDKLGRRGYALNKQTPVTSKNGVVGTRFDFTYVPPTSENEEKFYSAVLFVSDKHRVVIQMAGEADLSGSHDAQATRLASQIKVRGCRGKKVCKGPQPAALSTPSPAVIATGDEEPDPEPTPAPEPEPAPAPAPAPEKPTSDAK